MLLGQIKACFGRGMFATFIDFQKTYDRVDRNELWQCLQETLLYNVEGTTICTSKVSQIANN